MYKKVFLSFSMVFGIFFHHYAQNSSSKADSILQTLSLDDKIGQLFMIPVYASSDRRYED
jgi:hypothetical protein